MNKVLEKIIQWQLDIRRYFFADAPSPTNDAANAPNEHLKRNFWQKSRILRLLFPPSLKEGDVMVFDDLKINPFDPPGQVVIVDIKDGWVLFRGNSKHSCRTFSSKLRSFSCWYFKV